MVPFIWQALLGAGTEIMQELRSLYFSDVMMLPLAKLL